ncbi:3'-5' exonuclease [Paraferrimonas sp. SM1919]|uniref:3'-5' exonuclease n=1 Tax=Paraferrimonas sp. SM1919 TaxID=2662263 RepID=UPI0013D4403D|nr:3'-5' exonuclease [Paraferrimonas sp. SM1919]
MFKLDEHQQKVINLTKGRHTVFSSAGSGKTEVLTRRIELALQNGVDPEKMLCLTFTNRAALNMKQRAQSAIGNKVEDVFIGNTHTLGINLSNKYKRIPASASLTTEDIINDIWKLSFNNVINKIRDHWTSLKEANDLADTPLIPSTANNLAFEKADPLTLPASTIFNSNECLELAKLFELFNVEIPTVRELFTELASSNKANEQLNNRIKPLHSKVTSILSSHESSFLDKKAVEKFSHQAMAALEHNASAQVYSSCLSFNSLCLLATEVGKEYSKLKKSLQIIDFDDLLLGLLDIPSQGYQWIQVDEVQDLSALQWLILEHHSASGAHQVYFGDINQSIYDFLGADINFTRSSVSNSLHELPVNYRSPQGMVDLFSNYMRLNFPKNDQFTVQSNIENNNNCLVHLCGDKETTLEPYLIRHTKNLSEQDRNVAILCPSNQVVSNYSAQLNDKGIQHFMVSQLDLFTKKPVLDFTSLIRAISNHRDFSAWGRMLWNLALTTSTATSESHLPPQLLALDVAAGLNSKFIYLSDFIKAENVYDHGLRKLQSLQQTGYVYFDTETTGLSATNDQIIQIAAVKVNPDGTKDELDLYCQSDKPVGESEKIHKISDQKLQEEGKPLAEQLTKFLDFVEDLPVVAHNLAFDQKMLKAAVTKVIPNSLKALDTLESLCSLKYSRRLFPDLRSHKLGNLLEEFNLEGVNSHNAIDDVRAGVSLMEFIIKHTNTIIDDADNYIDKHESLLDNFHRNLATLFQFIQPTIQSPDLTVQALIASFLEFVSTSRRTMLNNNEADYVKTMSEFERKLSRWLKAEKLIGKPEQLVPLLADKFLSIKEVDLITEADKVIVSTIHRSKGLEFDHVLLPDVTDHAFPCYPVVVMPDSPKKQAALEEQKRLLYVAMTRAKKQLVIGTYARNKWGYPKYPSTYIAPLLDRFQTHNVISK